MLPIEYLSIYVHIPFCRTRCYYCDFNTYAGLSHLIKPYIQSLNYEIENISQRINTEQNVHTIFFGGGTPSILPIEKISAVIQQVTDTFKITGDAEISMEVNPVALTAGYLEKMRSAGVNRISLGMQSASLEELLMLGRKHTFEDVEKSIDLARQADFENINLDVIFGLPGQDLETFEMTLDAAIKIKPPHLSLYSLTIEHGTHLAAMIAEGRLPEPDSDTAADMYTLAMERLEQEKYLQYEISNWAIDTTYECKHNLQYWRNQEYLGFGAGAHSHYRKWRWENAENIGSYIQKIENRVQERNWISPAAVVQTELNLNDNVGETMMMGLRLTDEGVSENRLHEQFGIDLKEFYRKEIVDLLKQNLVEWVAKIDGPHLRLTRRGRMLGNQVFMQFLKD